MDEKTVTLDSLVGLHTISGYDMTDELNEYHDSMQIVNVVMDGLTYTIHENPDDGYRSYAEGDIRVSNKKIVNRFQPFEAIAVKRLGGTYGNDVLDIYDLKNGQRIISVGTENSDDYYPSFLAEFMPENIHYNADTTEE